MNTGNPASEKNRGSLLSSKTSLKAKNSFSKMDNLFLDVGKGEQKKIVSALWEKTGLTSRELAKALDWGRASLFTYKNGRHRLPYTCLQKLCELANVDIKTYSVKLVEINNQPNWEKLDLSGVDDSQFKPLSPKEWQKVVAVGLLTDGYFYHRKIDNKYTIKFHSSDKSLHKFLQKLVIFAFNEAASSFTKDKDQNLWTTHYHRGTNNSMIKKLLSFTKTYCTNEGSIPSLNFLLNEKKEVKIQALRFAMSCDGSVSIKNSVNYGRSYALRLACAHPELNLQWQKLFRDIGIGMCIDRDKANWSGIHGLASGKRDSFKRFAELGGFLPTNVKVTNGNFVGMRKNEVLNEILELTHK